MKARRTALLALAALLAPRSPTVAARVALACDDAAAYAKKYAASLRARSANAGHEGLPWLALVDALEAERRLASIDWKTSFEDLTWALDRLRSLPKKARRWAWAKEHADELEDRTTLELLEIVGARLQRERLALLQLDTGADEHELVVVPRRSVARLRALGAKAKYGDVDVFTGSDLARFERERVRADAEAIRARDADPHRQRNFIHPDGRVWITYGQEWSEGTKRRYALRTVAGTLGSGTHSRDPEQLLSNTLAVIEKRRARAIAARLAEGFEEVALETYASRENAAQRARKRKRKPKAR